jgi:GTP-binding protein
VVNKIDRPEQRAHEVVDEVFDLLVELGADDHQLDFPIVYTSAKQGTAALTPEAERKDLRPLLDLILEQAPAPVVDVEGPLQFQAVTLGWDEFVGRLVIGRVERGTLRRGVTVVRIPETGPAQSFRITKLFAPQGLDRVERESASAGEIAIIAGVDTIEIGDTVCPPDAQESLPRIAIDPPTVSVRFSVNNSPFAGQEGKYVTSRQIGDRLRREALTNVSIRIGTGEATDTFEVSGRGELQIAVLIETMRREGFEFAVTQPQIIERTIDGKRCEPVEDVVAEVPQEATGAVLEKLGSRRGVVQMESRGARRC